MRSDSPARPAIRADVLGDALLLVVWDEPAAQTDPVHGEADRAASRIVIARLEDGARAVAQSSLHLAPECEAGQPSRRRFYLLLRFAGAALAASGELRLEGDFDPPRSVGWSGGAREAASLARDLTHGLDGAGRDRLARWLLRFCGGRAGAAPDAARLAGALCAAAAIDDRKLEWLAGVGDAHCLLGSELPAAIGPVQFVAVIGETGVVLGRAGEARAVSPWAVVEKSAMRGARLCVIAGSRSMAIRRIEARRPNTMDLLAWMKSHADDRGDRLDDVLTAIEPCARRDAGVRSLALELQLRFPRRRRASLQAHAPVAAELRLAVADEHGGVFLCGWLHDPHDLVDSATLETLFGGRHPVDLTAARFPSSDAAERCKQLGRDGGCGEEPGFAAYVQGAVSTVRCLQPRLLIRLRSGTRLHLVPAVQPHDPARAKALVLAAVPTPCIDTDMLERCLNPSVSRLHDEHMRRERIGAIHEFGPRHDAPTVSVVVPLYRNLRYLKTQLAALALDPGMRETEVILVLDSPEIARTLLHLLEGLHACYGIALRVVIMRENFGYAAACNAGASQARAAELLMLNSDVLPRHRGWLEILRGALDGNAGVAAVGPRLLFDDGSLQHAGLHFSRDGRGRWLNRHYHKGLPGGHAPANQPREVPGVTGACLLVSAAAFRDVGGFSECYVFGDYEDSDLCLKLREAGGTIRYEPRASLYHVERKSIELHDGYTRGAAWLYNCARHQRRWEDAMATLVERFDGGDRPSRPGASGARPAVPATPAVVALEAGSGARS